MRGRDRLGEALAHGAHAERLVERRAAAARARRRRVVSIITPSDARTRFGSAQHREVVARGRAARRASACDVTSQPPSAGTHETGSASRSRSSAPMRAVLARSANSIAAPDREPPPALAPTASSGYDLRDELHCGQTAAAVGRHHASIPRSDAIAPAALPAPGDLAGRRRGRGPAQPVAAVPRPASRSGSTSGPRSSRSGSAARPTSGR